MDHRDARLRSLRGRIGAYRLHATHDPQETTAAAQSAIEARFFAEVDPDGELPPDERRRRADAARRAHFARLAYASAKKRAAARRPAANSKESAADTESWTGSDR